MSDTQRLLGLVYHALGRNDDALRSVRRGLGKSHEVLQSVIAASQLLQELGNAPAPAEEPRSTAEDDDDEG